jgi:hypothetical protein
MVLNLIDSFIEKSNEPNIIVLSTVSGGVGILDLKIQNRLLLLLRVSAQLSDHHD